MKESDDVQYIAALAKELCKIAFRAKRPVLVYLLSLVIAEAETP